MNTTEEEVEFDYQAYMKDYVPDPDKIETAAECVILKGGKGDILTSLDKVSGISEGTIYPDFDGFARLHAHNKSYVEPDPQDHLQRGSEVYQRGDLDDAIDRYDEAISLRNPEGDLE